MASFNKIIQTISEIDIDGMIELELKIILDKRIRSPYFIKNKLNIDVKNFYLYIIEQLKSYNISKSQTVNFIKSDKNYNMTVKQLHFKGDVQLKELKSYYIKQSLIPPIFLESIGSPLIKMSVCNEKLITEIDPSIIYDLVRFKERYSILFDKNWRLDITLIKESNDINIINNISSLKTIIKKMFCNFDNHNYSDKIEFEIEYIGDIKSLDIIKIKDVDILFNKYITNFLNKNNNINTKNDVSDKLKKNHLIDLYTTNICRAAKLLKPNLLNKFQSGYFGLKQLGSNPIEIDKIIYYTDILSNLTDYIITDKIDGTRSMIFIYINKCYVINNKNIHSISELELNEQDLENGKKIFGDYKDEYIILDAELIYDESEKADLYYVFDIIKYINSNVFNFNFDDRLVYINKIIECYTFLQNKKFTYIQKLIDDNINIKNFYKQNCKSIIQNNKYLTDGLIIFNRNSNYNDTKYYKWKPICTIDFYLKKCPDNILGVDPYVNKPNKTLYILFSGINDIDYNNLSITKSKYYYDILGKQKFNKKYFPIQFTPSDNPWAYLFWHTDDNLDGKIVELTYDNEWKFINIRDDRMNDMARKTYYGNYLKYAELIWFNIQNKLSLDDMVYNTDIIRDKSYFKISYNTDYSTIRKFNNFVKLKLVELNTNTICLDNIIDICSGRGQDLQKYINCGFKNIFMFDNDMDGIIEIINRKYKYSKTKQKDINKYPNIYAKKLNFLDHPKCNIESIKNLIKISNVNKVKIVVCNFALHYLVYNKTKLNNFVRLLNDILDSGGIFIFTAFDGNKIFDILSQTDEYERYENGKKKYSIKKKYESDEFTGLGYKVDVLLPFSNNEYYTEYLINIDLIKSALKIKGINLMIESSFSEYLKSFKEEKKYFYDNLTDIDKEYIDLHNFYIFHKSGKKKI